MSGLIDSKVEQETTLSEGYLEHAAPESMRARLEDWKKAQKRLNGQITVLRRRYRRRIIDRDAGRWPPPKDDG